MFPALKAFAVMVALVVAVALGATVADANDTTSVRVRIPVCAEDEPYLVGRGDFDGQRWDRYRCVHVDAVGR